ncbi:MAG TPA: transcription antitermination factor NusB [Bacteroidales bacterium]|nr:transcription antitermination factor NusB [Bacteroidales bacterium]HOK74646.1 transcription antitermination factor NusB [Bacteroidales bacterium]HPP93419.1 transcription antitermination factor NusB [Bacteroidales bacterium]
MLSRRLLRIKALICLYAYNRRDDGDLAKAENELMFSINKSYELYFYLLLLILELADVALEKINFGLRKKMPSKEDLNPNRRFVDNRIIAQLRINNALKKYQESKRISWNINPDLPKILYNQMVKWEPYIKYMNDEKTGYSEDKKFITKLVTDFFPSSEELLNAFEEQSIYWNDDIDYISLMVEKTLKKFKANSGPEVPLMPLFKNEDDEHFVKHLFRQAILKAKQNIELIDRNTTNWEVERIALMDRLVMQLAITEIVEFEEIPVKVTLNEYIEIAKQYCTSKSSNFVNGILDKIVKEMREKGLFRKSGRGLLGETE